MTEIMNTCVIVSQDDSTKTFLKREKSRGLFCIYVYIRDEPCNSPSPQSLSSNPLGLSLHLVCTPPAQPHAADLDLKDPSPSRGLTWNLTPSSTSVQTQTIPPGSGSVPPSPALDLRLEIVRGFQMPLWSQIPLFQGNCAQK